MLHAAQTVFGRVSLSVFFGQKIGVSQGQCQVALAPTGGYSRGKTRAQHVECSFGFRSRRRGSLVEHDEKGTDPSENSLETPPGSKNPNDFEVSQPCHSECLKYSGSGLDGMAWKEVWEVRKNRVLEYQGFSFAIVVPRRLLWTPGNYHPCIPRLAGASFLDPGGTLPIRYLALDRERALVF